MNKRTRSFLLFVAAILLGLWLGRLLRPSGSQLQGTLSFDSAKVSQSEFPAGNFIIYWDDENVQLTVEHNSRPGFPLWQSLPGESFVQAAQGQETVTERRGMFTVRDRWDDSCVDQEIVDIRKSTDITNGIEISGRLYCQSGQDIAYSIFFYTYEGDPDRLEINLAAEANRVFLTYSSSENEHFFGFGEQFSFVDMKGRRVPVWVTEQGVGRGDQPITISADLTNDGAGGDKFTTYAPLPFYITSQMRSLLVLNSGYSAFDLRNSNRVQVEALGED